MALKILSVLVLATIGFASSMGVSQPGQNNGQPKVVDWKAPVYPAIAQTAHASGSVVVEVGIDASGKVTASRAITGHPLLVAASRTAALGWRFEVSPGGDGTRAVALTFDFSLDAARCNPVFAITPYHLRISPDPPPETASYVPDNAETNCKLHGISMLRDRVEIIYGLVEVPGDYRNAQKRLFPNASSEVFGGCLLEIENCDGHERQLSPKYAEVLYCTKCRQAQQRWIKKHPRK